MTQTTDTGFEIAKWLGGAAAGALLMYMLDPDRGSARRAHSVSSVRNMGARTSSAVGNAWRSAGSRLGIAADDAGGSAVDAAAGAVRAALPDGAADRAGTALEHGMAKTRGTLGRASEAVSDAVSEGVSKSVSRAQDALGRAGAALGDTYDSASRRAGKLGGRMRDAVQGGPEGEWAPTTRNSALAGGGLLALYGLMRRSPLGLVAALAGAALLARGAANKPLGGLLHGQGLSLSGLRGLAPDMDQTIDFEKTIHIDAPPHEVYDLWTDYENFPHFMSHVVEVRDLGRGRSHWVVKGPGGSEFEWNSRLTEQNRPHRLAWRSEAGAEIPQTGSIHFDLNRGGTDVTVRMSYTPPAGAIGHGLARLLGADPKARMDEDLARMKAFIERGVVPRDAAQPRAGSRFLH